MSGDGGSSWTARKTVDLTSTLGGRVFGSATDTWGWDDPDRDPPSIDDGSFRLEVRNEDPGAGCSGTTSVDAIGVVVTYRTIDEGTANGPLSDAVCDKADFNFVIDMSGSIGLQGSEPVQPAGPQGRHQRLRRELPGGRRRRHLQRDPIQRLVRRDARPVATTRPPTFLADVDALSNPSGTTPTASGISTGAAQQRR